MMDDMQFYILFNSVSVISGQWKVDNERLYAKEFCLRLKRLRLKGIELGPLDKYASA